MTGLHLLVGMTEPQSLVGMMRQQSLVGMTVQLLYADELDSSCLEMIVSSKSRQGPSHGFLQRCLCSVVGGESTGIIRLLVTVDELRVQEFQIGVCAALIADLRHSQQLRGPLQAAAPVRFNGFARLLKLPKRCFNLKKGCAPR